MYKIVCVTLLGILNTVSDAWACQPCFKQWDLSQSIEQAEVIITGKRNTPKTVGEEKMDSGPAVVEIAVESVLKGELQAKTINVSAWFGMCPYGIVTPPGELYVMLLKKNKENLYDAVYEDCGVKALAVKDEQVQIPNGPLDMQQFRQLIK